MMSQYILFTTTDRYKTVVDNPQLEKVAEYQYYFFGKLRSTFTVCTKKSTDTKICIQAGTEKFPDNHIPLNVFPKFDSIEDIEKDIYELEIDKDAKVVKTL